MTIKDSLHFEYDEIASYDMGIFNVSTSLGLYEEAIAGNRSIEEDRDISGRRYLKNIDSDPLEFEITFKYENKFDDKKIRETAKWLLQDSYKTLKFSNDLDKVYFAVPVGSYRLIHNGLKQGYITLTFRCNTYHAYSPVYRSITSNLSNNPTDGTVVKFENSGDLDTQPIIYIHKFGDGDVSFTNLSNNGQNMSISNLVDYEEIKIDCLNKEIETNTGFNRYDNFNFNWLNLIYGINHVKVEGNCILHYVIQEKMY